MFVVNGDGTYTVKFFNSNVAHYVTVDSFLPTNSAGQLVYATRGAMYNNGGNELWVALAEKAYAQLNEFGWSRAVVAASSGKNSYAALDGGYLNAALNHITGSATVNFAMTSATNSFQTFVTAWNAGKMIGFASFQTTPAGSQVVGGHAYAVVGYNATNQTVTFFNPWGTEYGLVTHDLEPDPSELPVLRSNGLAAASGRLTPQRQYQPAAAAMAAMLAEIDALPGPQSERAAVHRDREARTQQRGLHMRRHVVRAFARVPIREILRRDRRERRLQVDRHIGVRVLVDRERRRRVLNENLQQRRRRIEPIPVTPRGRPA